MDQEDLGEIITISDNELKIYRVMGQPLGPDSNNPHNEIKYFYIFEDKNSNNKYIVKLTSAQ